MALKKKELELIQDETLDIKIFANCFNMAGGIVFKKIEGTLYITNKRVCFYGRGFGDTHIEMFYNEIKEAKKAYLMLECPLPGLGFKIFTDEGYHSFTAMKRAKILELIEKNLSQNR